MSEETLDMYITLYRTWRKEALCSRIYLDNLLMMAFNLSSGDYPEEVKNYVNEILEGIFKKLKKEECI